MAEKTTARLVPRPVEAPAATARRLEAEAASAAQVAAEEWRTALGLTLALSQDLAALSHAPAGVRDEARRLALMLEPVVRRQAALG
jgi:hypothetical protein